MTSICTDLISCCILLMLTNQCIRSDELISESVRMEHPKESVIELTEGAKLQLDCTSLRNTSAADIIWYLNFEQLLNKSTIPQLTTTEFSSTSVTINITSFRQSGTYSCGLSGDNKELWANTTVTVGSKPPSMKNLSCIEINYTRVFNCSWLPGDKETNLPMNYIFTFPYSKSRYDIYLKESGEKWRIVEYAEQELTIKVNANNSLGYGPRSSTTYNVVVGPPCDVNAEPNNTGLLVTWSFPEGRGKLVHSIMYSVKYRKTYPENTTSFQQSPEQNKHEYRINSAGSYAEYEIQVGSHYSDLDAWSPIKKCSTKETKPTGPIHAMCEIIQQTSTYQDIRCAWEPLPKEQHNGKLLGYRVVVLENDILYLEDEDEYNATEKLIIAEFKGLLMANSYVIKLTAFNKAGDTAPYIYYLHRQTITEFNSLYIVLIVSICVVMVLSLVILMRHFIRNIKPYPEPKYCMAYKWENTKPEKRESEKFDPLKEKGNATEKVCMLQEIETQVCNTDINHKGLPSSEVTNLTYLVMGHKIEQLRMDADHSFLADDSAKQELNSSSDLASNDTHVCYLQLSNGNVLAELQSVADASGTSCDDPSITTHEFTNDVQLVGASRNCDEQKNMVIPTIQTGDVSGEEIRPNHGFTMDPMTLDQSVDTSLSSFSDRSFDIPYNKLLNGNVNDGDYMPINNNSKYFPHFTSAYERSTSTNSSNIISVSGQSYQTADTDLSTD